MAIVLPLDVTQHAQIEEVVAQARRKLSGKRAMKVPLPIDVDTTAERTERAG